MVELSKVELYSTNLYKLLSTSRRNPKVWQNSGACVCHPCNFKAWRKKILFHKFLTIQQKSRLILILKFLPFFCLMAIAKSCQRVKFHNYRATVWMENKLWKSCAMKSLTGQRGFCTMPRSTLLHCAALLFCLRFFYFCWHFLGTVLVKCHNPRKSSKNFICIKAPTKRTVKQSKA